MGHLEKLKLLFFENPIESFSLREISRRTGIPKSSAGRYMDRLIKDKIAIKINKAAISFAANEENRNYRTEKKLHALKIIYGSNLVEYLNNEFSPRAIILFGSFSKGEFTKNSDIDIFVQSSEKKINITKYERILRHKINLFFEQNINKLSNELFNNIINGIKLSGYIKIR